MAAALLAAFAAAGAIADGRGDDGDPRCDALDAQQSITLAEAVANSLSNEPHLSLARLDVVESKADLKAATAPFLPKGQIILDEERLLPSREALPVTVVGSNILGGARAYSAYGAISVSWNVMNSGRDMAGYRAAQAGVRSTAAALYAQLDDTLNTLLGGYADAYEAQLSVRQQVGALGILSRIESRAMERFEHGSGTTIALGQARAAKLDAERSLNESCNTLTQKSLALAKAMGIRLPRGQLMLTKGEIPERTALEASPADFEAAIENDPAVIAAKEKAAEAEAKLRQTHAAFGPSVSIDAKRDYLGQNADSLASADRGIGPYSYRIGVSLIQPIFPFTTESSAIDKANAELRRAQVAVEQSRNDVDAKLRAAISAQAEAGASFRAARSSLDEARQVYALTQSLYAAGRTDLDSVEHAQLDLDKVQFETFALTSRLLVANWAVARALQANRFPHVLLNQLGIEFSDDLFGH